MGEGEEGEEKGNKKEREGRGREGRGGEGKRREEKGEKRQSLNFLGKASALFHNSRCHYIPNTNIITNITISKNQLHFNFFQPQPDCSYFLFAYDFFQKTILASVE